MKFLSLLHCSLLLQNIKLSLKICQDVVKLSALLKQGYARSENFFLWQQLEVNGENLPLEHIWHAQDTRQKGSFLLTGLVFQAELRATGKGSEIVCGHSVLLCSVTTAHALHPGQTLCNAYGMLLQSLWDGWIRCGWISSAPNPWPEEQLKTHTQWVVRNCVSDVNHYCQNLSIQGLASLNNIINSW